MSNYATQSATGRMRYVPNPMSVMSAMLRGKSCHSRHQVFVHSPFWWWTTSAKSRLSAFLSTYLNFFAHVSFWFLCFWEVLHNNPNFFCRTVLRSLECMGMYVCFLTLKGSMWGFISDLVTSGGRTLVDGIACSVVVTLTSFYLDFYQEAHVLSIQ